MVTKTYLPSNLWDRSDSSDSNDSNDSSDSCDSSDKSDSRDSSESSDSSDQKRKKTIFPPQKKSLKNSKTEIVMKLKNSNCDENQKLKL